MLTSGSTSSSITTSQPVRHFPPPAPASSNNAHRGAGDPTNPFDPSNPASPFNFSSTPAAPRQSVLGVTPEAMAARLIDMNLSAAGLNITGLQSQTELTKLLDPGISSRLDAAVLAQLGPRQQGEFLRLAQDGGQTAPAPAPASNGPSTATMVADLTQMTLDLTGIVEPTPFSDGANAVISAGRSLNSLFRGNWGDAGGHFVNGVISVAGVVPLLGDLAKAGKIGKWAETVANAVTLAVRNPAAASKLRPLLEQAHDLVNKIPQGAIDKMPKGARESLERMKSQLDEFINPSTRGVDVVVGASQATARIGRNSAEWTLDGAGRPTRVTAELSELRGGSVRSSAERDAQTGVGKSGIDGDEGGHLIGHRFMGDQGVRNLFPQNFNFNRGAYKTMENEWAAWIEHGATVKVDVKLVGGTGGRPDTVVATYKVYNDAGDMVFKNDDRFANAAGQTFDRLSPAEIAARLGQ